MRTILALAIAATALSAQAVLIDDFTDGDFSHSLTSGAYNHAYGATVAGDYRWLTQVVDDNPDNLNSTAETSSGDFSLTNDRGVSSYVWLGYGTENPFDLDLNGYWSFSIDILSCTGDTMMIVQADDAINGSQWTNTQVVGPINSPTTVHVLTSGFSWGVDHVRDFYLGFRAPVGGEIVVDNFQLNAVPEPASLTLGLGALVALATKRRLKKA